MTDSEIIDQDEPIAEEGSYDSPEALLQRLIEERAGLIAERDEAKDNALRTLAEMQNFRRRKEDEMASARKYAAEQLVTNLLPVLDNFERTLGAAETGASMEALLEGVKLVDRQLRSVLESVQLAKIEAMGVHFDPSHHEAIGVEESEEHEDGTVILELQPGYKMADRVIRPALVKVSKKP